MSTEDTSKATAEPRIITSGRTPQQAAIDNLGDLQLTARLTGAERENVIEARIVLKKLVNEYDALCAVAEAAGKVSNDWDDNYELLQKSLSQLSAIRKGETK